MYPNRKVFEDVITGDFSGHKIVHHHKHIEMTWVGPAHNQCNMLLDQRIKVPIFFHNLGSKLKIFTNVGFSVIVRILAIVIFSTIVRFLVNKSPFFRI